MATVAVNALHAPFLMYVGLELVIFNAIWAEVVIVSRVGGSVLSVEIVFETPMVISADVIAIMARQALFVARSAELV